MAEKDESDIFGDLDAFFSAAESGDVDAVEKAAKHVTGVRPREAGSAPKGNGRAADNEAATNAEADALAADVMNDFYGKFIAIEPEEGTDDAGNRPFILVPADIHAFLPWWGWAIIGVLLALLMTGIILFPMIRLNRLASRLDDANQAQVHTTMRQLVVRGDDQTVGKLYDMASSRRESLATRLKAIDTLSLIQSAEADRALLRLELAGGTDDRVRDAAIAARKQREAAKTRGEGR